MASTTGTARGAYLQALVECAPIAAGSRTERRPIDEQPHEARAADRRAAAGLAGRGGDGAAHVQALVDPDARPDQLRVYLSVIANVDRRRRRQRERDDKSRDHGW
jgi:hypothetical protein